jgi:hypothetical protein
LGKKLEQNISKHKLHPRIGWRNRREISLLRTPSANAKTSNPQELLSTFEYQGQSVVLPFHVFIFRKACGQQ